MIAPTIPSATPSTWWAPPGSDGELQLHFFTDGDVATNDGGVISYTWDGSYGEISEGSTALGMIYDEDGFFVEMNDGIYHEFTYIGEADINLLTR